MIYITPINRLHERVNPTAFNFLGDVSGSMNQIHEKGIMCDAINEIMLPSLKEAHPYHQDVLRISLGAFADDRIQSLTRGGYYAVDQLLRHPVRNNQLYKPGLNRGTALYASMISGINSCISAAQAIRKQMHYTTVRAILVVLTDGLNETNNTTRPTDVRHSIENADPNIKLDVRLAYFKTGVDVDRKQFNLIAEACGIPEKNCHFWADHGASGEKQRKAFRRLVKILSRLYSDQLMSF